MKKKSCITLINRFYDYPFKPIPKFQNLKSIKYKKNIKLNNIDYIYNLRIEKTLN